MNWIEVTLQGGEKAIINLDNITAIGSYGGRANLVLNGESGQLLEDDYEELRTRVLHMQSVRNK